MPRASTRAGSVAATLGSLGLGIAATGAAALLWASVIERRRYTLRRVSAKVLPPGSADIRVLHLSDLHLAPWQRDKQEWVRALARLMPDLVVNTGDNLGHTDAYDALKYTLEPFRGVPGVFVNGSNDYFGPSFKNPFRYFTGPSKANPTPTKLDIKRLEKFFGFLGWQNLNNRAASLQINGSAVEFFGVDDPHMFFDRLDKIPGALDDLRDDSDSADLSIGVAHAPYQRVLNSFVTHGADVIFAGHTHGGQVCVPGYGALVTNCDIPRDQVKGLSLWRHGLHTAVLNVSAGLGTSIYAPVRFSCLPEATLLTLTAKD